MDLTHAYEQAEAKLREVETPDNAPLRLDWDEGRGVEERSWCWIFWLNGERWFETGDDFDSILSGSIVVNKDGSDVWVLGTARPYEEFLDEYAAQHGYEPEGQSPK